MRYTDEIYGEFELEKVLVDLMKSEPVQRLKGVYQGGASVLVCDSWNVTRFEHSIGVMLLVKHLGGSMEEQIAALLHDVSHTAFSHVIDHVLEYKGEDYHEKIYQSLIESSNIPSILSKHGYDYKNILNDFNQWTILERDAPHLCADRIDYTLRDLYRDKQIEQNDIDRFLHDLTIGNGTLHLQTIEAAEWFVQTYYKEVQDFFLHPKNIYAYNRLSKLLKLALQKNILNMDDLLKQDSQVIDILKKSNDKEIHSLWDTIHRNIHVEAAEDNYDIFMKMKPRLINPDLIRGTEVISASTISSNVREINAKAYQKALRGTGVRIVAN